MTDAYFPEDGSNARRQSSSSRKSATKLPLLRVSAVGKSDRPEKSDVLDRGVFVSAISALIANKQTRTPLTIGIYGPWGSGKSSFLAQITERLGRAHDVVNFNPWRLSNRGEVWSALVAEIAPVLDKRLGFTRRLKFLFSADATRSVSKLYTRIVAAGKKVGTWLTVATATGGLLAYYLPPIKLADRLGNSLPISRSACGGPFCEFALYLNQHFGWLKWSDLVGLICVVIVGSVVFFRLIATLTWPFTTQFKANLAQFGDNPQALKSTTFKDFEALREIIGDFARKRARDNRTLVLLIDDLDRCGPERIGDVLEAVNMFVAELPIITVIAIDTKYVCSAVAAQHNFLFAQNDGPEVKERYGRLFLEKIIHIPFQLPAVHSYQRYVEELLRISDEPDDAAAAAPVVPMPSVRELLSESSGLQRVLRAPIAWYAKNALSFVSKFALSGDETDRRWLASIALHFLFGLDMTSGQRAWLSQQDFATRRAVEFQIEQARGKFMLLRVFNLSAKTRLEVMSAAIQIQDSDRRILGSHISDLRGNPRSIKRFINTYLLAKGIQTLLPEMVSSGIALEDMAAWLVLLQNWPPQASKVCGGRARAQANERLFSSDWEKRYLGDEKAPAEMIAFVGAHKRKLENLATSSTGFDVVRCFSFFSTD